MKIKQQGKNTNYLFSTIRLVFKNFFEHQVGKNAAALAYYLLFALFPLMVFISNLLGLLDLNIIGISHGLQRLFPKDVVGLLETYLEYVSHSSSHILLWFSLVFSIWFPMRAVKGLMDDVRLAYHLSKPRSTMKYMVHQLGYTILLLVVIALTLILSTLGQHVLGHINTLFSEQALRLPELFLRIWQYLRFVPVGFLMYAALGTLYAAALDEWQTKESLMPGSVVALVLWMVVSVAFSFYVENFANYSVIYGTLGAVIVLLMWLYMTSVILILGAEINAALMIVRSEKK